ncbi:MAG: M16 family metallopeptidase [Actinomycetota bacterium]
MSHQSALRHPALLAVGALALLLPSAAVRSYAQEAAAPATAPPVSRRTPLRVATLSNGLRLTCRTNDSSELVSVVCLVRAGVVEEREDQAGIAALTAEAIIKGTTRHSAQGFDAAIVEAGGDLRSFPGFDLTEVSVQCGKNQFEKALKILADVLTHPSLTDEQIKIARDRLKSRSARLAEDFTGSSYQALVGQLHPRTPYGRPVNGYAATLDAIKPADVRKFWQDHYVQNRMVVAIVGDVNSSRALELAQKAFLDAPWKPGNVMATPAREVIARPRVEVIQRPGPAAQLMVGYLAPGVTRQNYPVYAVLDAILGGGKRGRLFANIREKHSLGYQLGSFYQPLLHQSHLVEYVVTPPFRRNPRTEQPEGVVDLVRTHLLAQVRDLADNGPTDAEIVRARNFVIGRYALRQERTRDQSKWLAWNVAMNLGTDFDEHFNARVPAVTREQVQAAAKAIASQYALVITLPDEK